jgi:hypothetical protein
MASSGSFRDCRTTNFWSRKALYAALQRLELNGWIRGCLGRDVEQSAGEELAIARVMGAE